MKTTYYYNFNFLKIIFTIIVILYHFIRQLGFWCEGGYAVELFFLISGFLCAATFNKKLNIIDFAKKKIISFMPFLIIAILTLIPFKNYSAKTILNNIFLTPIWHHDLFVSIAWYINVWFWLSLCLFSLMKTLKKEQINLIVGISCFISLCCMLTYNRWLTWEKINFLNAGYFRGILSMGVGYLLFNMLPPSNFNITCCKTKNLLINKLFYTGYECFFLGYTVCCMFFKDLYISPLFVFIPSTILFYLFIQKKGYLSQATNHPFFLKLGKFILPIYVLQETPLALFSHTLTNYKDTLITYSYITIPTVVFIVIAWGIANYYLVKTISKFFLYLQKKHLNKEQNQ